QAKMGEDVTYTIEVFARKEFHIEFPDFGAHLQKEFAIRDLQTPNPEVVSGDYQRHLQIYTINGYTVGKFTIEPATIRYSKKGTSENATPVTPEKEASEKEVKELKSPEIFLEILSPLQLDQEGKVIESTEDIEDIESALEIPKPKKDYSRFLAILVGIAMGLFILIYLVLRRSSVNEIIKLIPAHIVALTELKRIQSLDLVAKQEYKKYYNLVSFCLRSYLENRFNLKAPERTTPEFVKEMVQTDCFAEDKKNQLREFLLHCDLVKFAKEIPSEPQCLAIFKTVETFIESTKLLDPEEEADPTEEEKHV
ncbi:MAG: hypothetical protein AABZ60_14610, partial [Planctomycetota bacterium]